MNCKKIFFAILLLTIQLSSFSQNSTRKYSLNELIDSAIKTNFDLQANYLKDNLSLNDIQLLARNFQPKIGAAATFSYWDWLPPNKEKMLQGGRTDMFIEISAYQLLYDWGRNNQLQHIERANISINQELQRVLKQTIAATVTQTYMNVLKQQKKIDIIKNIIERLNVQLKVSEQLHLIGKVTKFDLLRTQVSISIKERDLVVAKADFEKMSSDLKYLAFIESDQPLSIEDKAEYLFDQHEGKIPANISAILDNHPMLKSYEENILQQNLQIDFHKKQNRPEFFSYANTNWESAYIPFSRNFNYSIGLGLRYTIPLGGGRTFREEITRNRLRIEQLTQEQKQAENDLQKQISATFILLQNKLAEIEQNRHITSLSEETLKNALVLYEGGQENILNVLDTQSIVAEQSIAYKESIVDYLILLARLHYLTGNDSYPFN